MSAAKKNYTMSLDSEIVERAKQLAGMIPFSRYVEHVLAKEIAEHEGGG